MVDFNPGDVVLVPQQNWQVHDSFADASDDSATPQFPVLVVPVVDGLGRSRRFALKATGTDLWRFINSSVSEDGYPAVPSNVQAIFPSGPTDVPAPGIFMKLVATAPIACGQEILWHYQLSASHHAKPEIVNIKYFYDVRSAGTKIAARGKAGAKKPVCSSKAPAKPQAEVQAAVVAEVSAKALAKPQPAATEFQATRVAELFVKAPAKPLANTDPEKQASVTDDCDEGSDPELMALLDKIADEPCEKLNEGEEEDTRGDMDEDTKGNMDQDTAVVPYDGKGTVLNESADWQVVLGAENSSLRIFTKTKTRRMPKNTIFLTFDAAKGTFHTEAASDDRGAWMEASKSATVFFKKEIVKMKVRTINHHQPKSYKKVST